MRAIFVLIALFALFSTVIAVSDNLVRLQDLTKDKNSYTISFERTLHGLWPEWGFNCGSESFDENQVKPILSRMQNEWRSCPEYHNTEKSFWSHEWSKHGTCTGWSQLKYFSTALDLLERLSGKCSSGTTGECRMCLDMNLNVINC